jgi:hypothetical protein
MALPTQLELKLGWERAQRARSLVDLPKKALLCIALERLKDHEKLTLQLMNDVTELTKLYVVEHKSDVGMIVSDALIALRAKDANDLADALEGAFKAWREMQSRTP